MRTLRGCGSKDPAAAPEILAADAARATPAGSTFTAPGGWSITTQGPAVVLAAPEADARLAIVDAPAADADAAVATAWTAFSGAAAPWPLKLATPQAPRNGWDERRSYAYEISPNERKTVFATALRAGSAWTVVIVDASDASFGKR